MKVTIKETGETRELIAYVRGHEPIEWTADLIGNQTVTEHDADGVLVLTADDYDWWADYIRRLDRADDLKQLVADRCPDCDIDAELADELDGVEFADIPCAIITWAEGKLSPRPTSWRDLIVTDSKSDTAGTLGEIVDLAPANLDSATITDDRISEWPGFFLSVEGEEPDWDTPHASVDWSGFADALAIARGQQD